MLSTKGLLIGATAMQLALVSAAATPTVSSAGDSGQGIWDAFVCAGCAAGAVIGIASGAAEATAIALAAGGAGAVAIASAAAGCVRACVDAF